MSVSETIERKARESLKPQYLRVENESHRHRGPATESHFKLVVVSDAFEDLPRVRRHQRLYQLLAEELQACPGAASLYTLRVGRGQGTGAGLAGLSRRQQARGLIVTACSIKKVGAVFAIG